MKKKLSIILLSLMYLSWMSSCKFSFIEEIKTCEPMSLVVSDCENISGIFLSWSQEWYMHKYSLFRGIDPSDLSLYKESLMQTELLDTEAQIGLCYYYQIRAYRNNNNVVAQSPVVEGIRAYCQIDDVVAPYDIRASKGKYHGKIWVYWAGHTNSLFRIYRSDSLKGQYQPILETMKFEFFDHDIEAGKRYYYKIAALGKDRQNVVVKKSHKAAAEGWALNAPKNLIASQDLGGRIRISWEPDPQALSYIVYRYDQQSDTYIVEGSYVKGSEYIDDHLPSAKGLINQDGQLIYPSYFYKVQSVYGKECSPLSEAVEGRAIDPTDMLGCPDQVNLLENLTTDPPTFLLSCNSVLGAESYNISCYNKVTRELRVLAQAIVIPPNMNNRIEYQFADYQQLGTTVEYYVQANRLVDGLHLVSGVKAVQQYTFDVPGPVRIISATHGAIERKIIEKSVKKPTTIFRRIGFSIFSSASKVVTGFVIKEWYSTTVANFIELEWEPKQERVSCTYNVYRRPSGRGAFVCIVQGLKYCKFRDSTLKKHEVQAQRNNGQLRYPQYEYVVTAVYNGKESLFSNVISGSALDSDDILVAPNFLTVPVYSVGDASFHTTIIPDCESCQGSSVIPADQITDNFLYLTWGAVPHVQYYKIRSKTVSATTWCEHPRKFANEGTYAKISNYLSQDSILSSCGSTRKVYFEVSAISDNGQEGDLRGIIFEDAAYDPGLRP